MKKRRPNKRNVVYLCTTLQKALEEEHELIGGTRSSIIRTALQEYLNEQKIKRYKQMIAYEKLKKKAEDANV